MNLYTPERGDGESFEAYKARRIEARKALRAMTHPKPTPLHALVKHRKAEQSKTVRRNAIKSMGRRQYRRVRAFLKHAELTLS